MAEVVNRLMEWTSTRAYGLAFICLMIGLAIGYLARGSGEFAQTRTQQPAATAGFAGVPSMPTPEQLKHMVDVQTQPLLIQLKANPNDSALLATIGNMYYDAQQMPEAIKYYERSLKIDPKQVTVRTDLGTAYCRTGNAERGTAEFETVLKYDDRHENAYFNLGMARWQEKKDAAGAIKAWRELLAKNPNSPRKAKLEHMIAQLENAKKPAR